MDEARNELLAVRNAKKAIACDEYVTEFGDEIEERIFALITNYDEWERLKNASISSLTDEFEVRLKEIIDNIPHSHWSDVLKDFWWEFNIPKEDGTLPSAEHSHEELLCVVNATAGMPKFPPIKAGPTYEAYVKIWNYELVKYYLTHYRLNNLDKISVFQILMLGQKDPNDVLQRLKEKSSTMLFYDERKEKELKDSGYAAHHPESHFYIIGDFGSGDHQPKLKHWLASFKKSMAAIPQEQITVAETPDMPAELSFISSRFCIPATAMVNLASAEKTYLDRMARKLPPPLHIFRGEKESYRYEVEISNEFRTPYRKIHPLIVTLLEEEATVRRFLLAKILNLLKEGRELDSKTHKSKTYFQVGSEKLSSLEGTKVMYLSDLIYEFIYPPEEKELRYKGALAELETAVNDALKKMSKIKKKALIKEKIREFRSKMNESIPQWEKDLYKVWTIMLKEI